MSGYDEAREKFFSFLLRKTCTRKQAEEYLNRQKLPEGYYDAMMNEAEETGLIDDLTYAKLFAEGHLSWGNAKISHELGMRGVSRNDIETALDDTENEEKRAAELAEAWRKSGIEERKITARLISRGFANRAVRSVT